MWTASHFLLVHYLCHIGGAPGAGLLLLLLRRDLLKSRVQPSQSCPRTLGCCPGTLGPCRLTSGLVAASTIETLGDVELPTRLHHRVPILRSRCVPTPLLP